ncbi:MAG: hypothetical protein II776_00095 [Clostridia bacterium]|nr:hypothetical protein [Clostridia bacterium]
MEIYRWSKDRIRIRLAAEDLASMGLAPEDAVAFTEEFQRSLRLTLAYLKKTGDLPEDADLAEVFPGRGKVVVQLTARREEKVLFLKNEDEMLAVFPLAKEARCAVWKRRDGRGFYLAPPEERAERFREFGLPRRVRRSVLKEHCRRIL